MFGKKVALVVLVFMCLLSTTEGQIRKKSSSKAEKEIVEDSDNISFARRLNPEIKFGNLGFFNGFSISSKLNVGYKLSDRFTAGAGFKFFYDQLVVVNGPDPSNFDYGAFIYGRGKISNEFYLNAEYAFINYDFYQTSVNYPLFGLGYMSGYSNWRFGIEISYIASEQARDYQNSVIEYWFGASYNF